MARIALGLQEKLFLGNLDAQRDWGHAKDYVEAMWLMLQQTTPEDYVIATGVTTSIRDFIRASFAEVGIRLRFTGAGIHEKATIADCLHPDYQLPIGKEVLNIDPRYFRPTEVELLIGDPTKAQTKLGWQPKYDLAALVREMIQADIDAFKRDLLLLQEGHRTLNYFE